MIRRFAFAALVALALPASASATVVERDGAELVVRGEGTEANWIVLQRSGDESRLEVLDQGATFTDWPGDCEKSEWDETVSCPIPPAVELDLGGGADLVDPGDPPPGLDLTVLAGPGDDKVGLFEGTGGAIVVDGGDGNDELNGTTGPDTLRGGAGHDHLHGEQGPDVLEGGDGDDSLDGDVEGGSASDRIDGGAGHDTMQPDYAAAIGGVSVVQDGIGGDGRPGEDDNVTGIEVFVAPAVGSWSLTEGDDLFVITRRDDGRVIRALGGDDRIESRSGTEDIDAGPGDDWVDAGYGDDVIVAGPGRDTIYADDTGSDCDIDTHFYCTPPAGDDVVDARDGEADTVNCGVGTDRAVVDAIDMVSNCETVEKGGTGPGVPSGPGAAPCASTPKVKKLALKKARARAKRSGCSLKVRRVRSKRVKRGRVVRAKRVGTTVTLYVSKGR